jgi:predicted phage terminase large subunit-like protein
MKSELPDMWPSLTESVRQEVQETFKLLPVAEQVRLIREAEERERQVTERFREAKQLPLMRARQSLEQFTLRTKPDFELNWHHRVLFRYVEAWFAGKIKRLMVFMPPRMGKTESVSRRLPAYILGRNPDARIIACSYNASLAADANRDVQRIIDTDEYREIFPGTQLFGKNIRTVASGAWLRNSEVFEVVGRRGAYFCAGIGGGITGRGFQYGIIDDPIKGRQDADSDAFRRHIWNWYTGEFFTRRANNDACILLTLTRWHQDDLAGRLLDQCKQNPGLAQWTVLRFPAMSEEQDRDPEDIRAPGQALWPSRFDEKALSEARDTSGPRDWASVFQQRPSPAEGAVFKADCFRSFTEELTEEGNVFTLGHQDGDGPPPRRFKASDCRFFQCADTAMTVNKSSKFTCVGTFALTPQFDLLVYHIFRERLEVPEQFNALMELRNGAAVFNRTTRGWDAPGAFTPWPQRLMFQAVEDKASGIGLIQQAAAHGKPFRVLKGVLEKIQRAGPVSAMYQNGKVWHRFGAPWLSRFQDELLMFPSGTYNDQVDVTSYAGMLAAEDEYLRAGLSGELLVWPPVPGSQDAELLTNHDHDENIVRIGDQEVDFRDPELWDNT